MASVIQINNTYAILKLNLVISLTNLPTDRTNKNHKYEKCIIDSPAMCVVCCTYCLVNHRFKCLQTVLSGIVANTPKSIRFDCLQRRQVAPRQNAESVMYYDLEMKRFRKNENNGDRRLSHKYSLSSKTNQSHSFLCIRTCQPNNNHLSDLLFFFLFLNLYVRSSMPFVSNVFNSTFQMLHIYLFHCMSPEEIAIIEINLVATKYI